MMGDFGFGHMGFGWIFWLVLIIAAVFLLRRGFFTYRQNRDDSQSPLDILKQRYAKGEISKNQFERMKQDLV